MRRNMSCCELQYFLGVLHAGHVLSNTIMNIREVCVAPREAAHVLCSPMPKHCRKCCHHLARAFPVNEVNVCLICYLLDDKTGTRRPMSSPLVYCFGQWTDNPLALACEHTPSKGKLLLMKYWLTLATMRDHLGRESHNIFTLCLAMSQSHQNTISMWPMTCSYSTLQDRPQVTFFVREMVLAWTYFSRYSLLVMLPCFTIPILFQCIVSF